MKEIIFLHLGQAGLDIGECIWEQFRNEQGIGLDGSLSGSTNYQTLFSESANGKVSPRCIFADLDPEPICKLRSRPLYKPENFICGNEDSSNNFIRGHYTLGKNISPKIIDKIRQEAEACDNLQGFIISHSVGGGSGSGLNSLLLDHFSAYFNDKAKIDLSVFPCPFISSVIVEPYNALLSFESIIGHADSCIILDNKKIFDICAQKLCIERPSYKNIDNLIGYSVSSIFGTCINGGDSSQDLKEFSNYFLKSNRLKFLSTSISPIANKEQCYKENLSVSQITEQVIDPSFNQTSIDVNENITLASSLIYKGDIVPRDIDMALASIKSKSLKELAQCEVKCGYDETQLVSDSQNDIGNVSRSACFLRNSTGTQRLFEEICEKFDCVYDKRAFVHWFVGEGLSEGFFECAREELSVLINTYEESIN